MNADWAQGSLDGVARALSSSALWWSLVAFLALASVSRRSWRVLALAARLAIAIGITDAVNSHLLKEPIQRARPCKVYPGTRILADCGSYASMPSNHAANAMAAATTVLLSPYSRLAPMAFGVAVFVGWSRVHLGAHYPGDVLVGFLVGILLGWIVNRGIDRILLLTGFVRSPRFGR